MLIARVRNKFIFPARSVIKQEIKFTGEGDCEVPRGKTGARKMQNPRN